MFCLNFKGLGLIGFRARKQLIGTRIPRVFASQWPFVLYTFCKGLSDPHLEGQGNLVSRPIIHVVTLVIPILSLLTN